MAFASLEPEPEPELAQPLTETCRVQMSGAYEPRMVYPPGVGRRGVSRRGKGRGVAREATDRNPVRARATPDGISPVTPRAHGCLTATAKALTGYADENAGDEPG